MQIGKGVKQFLGFGKEGEGIEKTVASYGLSFIKDEKLAWRIEELEAGFAEIYGNAKDDVDKQIEIVDRLVHTVAVPWGRGGDDPGFAMMLMGWEMLMIHWGRYRHLRTIERIEGNETFFEDDERHELINMYGRKNVLRLGFLVIGRSFYGKDVTSSNIAMIQSSMAKAEGGIQPFYRSKYGDEAGKGVK